VERVISFHIPERSGQLLREHTCWSAPPRKGSDEGQWLDSHRSIRPELHLGCVGTIRSWMVDGGQLPPSVMLQSQGIGGTLSPLFHP